MPRLDISALTREKMEAFMTWAQGEEHLNLSLISASDKLSVHNGRISGKMFVTDAQGVPIMFEDKPVKVPFIAPQQNPLPEILEGG